MDEQKNGIAKLPRQTRAERLNTALYKKMFAEQERYRVWLLSQTPEEILNHTYEYTTREDILLCMEYEEISAKQALALLALPDPLNTVFDEYDRLLNATCRTFLKRSASGRTWRSSGSKSNGPVLNDRGDSNCQQSRNPFFCLRRRPHGTLHAAAKYICLSSPPPPTISSIAFGISS